MGAGGSKRRACLYAALVQADSSYDAYPIHYLYRDRPVLEESEGCERGRRPKGWLHRALWPLEGLFYFASLCPLRNTVGNERRLKPEKILNDRTRLYFHNYYSIDKPSFFWVMSLVACEAGSKADWHCQRLQLPLLNYADPGQCPFIFRHLSGEFFVSSAPLRCLSIFYAADVPVTWYEEGESMLDFSWSSDVQLDHLERMTFCGTWTAKENSQKTTTITDLLSAPSEEKFGKNEGGSFDDFDYKEAKCAGSDDDGSGRGVSEFVNKCGGTVEFSVGGSDGEYYDDGYSGGHFDAGGFDGDCNIM